MEKPVQIVNTNFCNGCNIKFETNIKYRIHYKSDLHTYNLKRKIVGLPPISEAIFNQKVEQFKLKK